MLAALLDVSRETVARVLSQLVKDKIISKEEGGIRLLDEKRLSVLAKEA